MLQLVPWTLLLALPPATAWIQGNETSTLINLANDRLSIVFNKTSTYIVSLELDGVNLLGTPAPGNPSTAIGPYMDFIGTPRQENYVPSAAEGAYSQLLNGTDSSGMAWGGIVMTQPKPDNVTGETLQQYWFLRANETSLHGFSRLTYVNDTVPFLADLQDIRTLFRPHGRFFTHLSSNPDINWPEPIPNPAVSSSDQQEAYLVQDTTWYIGNRTNDPFVNQVADYYTKYELTDTYRHHTVHGLFADGSETPNNETFGAWMIYNTKDTFWGGPTYSDLVVDGLLYNIIVSNHHGDKTPNITNGFDRTFGPSIYHFNHGAKGGSLQELRSEAESFGNVYYASQFYDDIAQHVPGYVTSDERGSWKAHIKLPKGANEPIAVLSAPGWDFQDNAQDVEAYQYWGEIDSNGDICIDRIKAGDYRLTVYASGIFGDFVYENVTISAMQQTNTGDITWTPESAGKELWRIGVPDRSAGEYRHGYAKDPSHPLHPPEYRIYWGAYDFINDFPNGVNFHVGTSDEATDFNYVHWSSFGGTLTRPEVVASPEISNWTITFDLDDISWAKEATLTFQYAGVSTTAGNGGTYNSKLPYQDLPLAVNINGNALEPYVVPWYRSGSCATRSGIICYHNRNKFTFPTSYLNSTNKMVLALPFNITVSDSPVAVSVMYDAIRLEAQ